MLMLLRPSRDMRRYRTSDICQWQQGGYAAYQWRPAIGPASWHNWSMPKFTIRRAKAQDADPLSDCIDAAYSVYGSRIADLPSMSDGISQTIESSRVWIAKTDSEIVGGIILIPHEEFMMLESKRSFESVADSA